MISTRAELAQLPEQTRNYVAKASKMIRDFFGAVEKHLEGASGKNGLHQSIRQPFSEFRTAIRAAAPDFRPHTSSGFCTGDAILPYPNCKVDNDKVIHLDEVKELANMYVTPLRPTIDLVAKSAPPVLSTRSRELPDHCPFQLLEDFASKFVARWESPAETLLEEVFHTLKAQLDDIISQHFPNDTYPVLSRNVK